MVGSDLDDDLVSSFPELPADFAAKPTLPLPEAVPKRVDFVTAEVLRMEPIDPSLRTFVLQQVGAVKDRESLETYILVHLTKNGGLLSLRDLNRVMGQLSLKYAGMPLQEVLKGMESLGMLGIRYSPPRKKTYVYSAEIWTIVTGKAQRNLALGAQGGPDPYLEMENSIDPPKAKPKRS